MADKKQSTVFGLLNNLASMINCTFRGQNTDVQSALTELDATYSTTETVVGTILIDGVEKKRYVKMIPLSNLVINATNATPHGITNIDKILQIKGCIVRSDGLGMLVLPFPYPSINSTVGVAVLETEIHVFIGSDFGTKFNYPNCGFAILEYTKTAD